MDRLWADQCDRLVVELSGPIAAELDGNGRGGSTVSYDIKMFCRSPDKANWEPLSLSYRRQRPLGAGVWETVMRSCPWERAMSPTPAASTTKPRNRLLAALSPPDLNLLRPHLTPVSLKLRQELERPNRRINDVYFVDAGIASVVAVQNPAKLVEIGLIGCEGMSGTSVVLGGQSSPHSTYLQVAGNGQHIAADALCKVLQVSRTLHVMLLKYVQAFMVQTAHTAIANAQANIEQRLARWILMAHDRVSGNVLPLTHEFLSLMLAVRRAGVTEALQNLAKQRLIKTGRGEIVVLNRRGLERAAGALYGVPEAEYRRLF
jgi:hypothetical protein